MVDYCRDMERCFIESSDAFWVFLFIPIPYQLPYLVFHMVISTMVVYHGNMFAKEKGMCKEIFRKRDNRLTY